MGGLALSGLNGLSGLVDTGGAVAAADYVDPDYVDPGYVEFAGLESLGKPVHPFLDWRRSEIVKAARWIYRRLAA